MHPNPVFRSAQAQHSLEFARTRSFGTLAMNAGPAPLFAHIPFLLSDDTSNADLHLVRSNPIARTISKGARAVRLAVTAPDSYISPDWYGVEDQVPTWNHVSVRFTGQLEFQPQKHLHVLHSRQSAHCENQLLPKTPWPSDKMTPEVMEKMMRTIVPVRLHIDDIQSTWKLGQNKPDAIRQRAAAHVAEQDIGADTQTLAAWMATPPSTN